jgi:hypothetical protein
MARGADTWHLTVRVYAAANLDRGAQVKLDALMAPSGSSSVKAAVESDRTLGNVVNDAHVVRCSGYRVYERGGQAALLGAEWLVEVIA